jgi:hypothetical protein
MSANTCPGGGDLTEQGVGVARDPVVVALVRDPFATAPLTSVERLRPNPSGHQCQSARYALSTVRSGPTAPGSIVVAGMPFNHTCRILIIIPGTNHDRRTEGFASTPVLNEMRT